MSLADELLPTSLPAEIRAAPAAAARSIDVVVKITERCNLACTYCYFFFKDDQSHALHSPVMSERTYRRLAEFLGQGIEDLGLDTVNIIFHGGEPLLMKPARFRHLCETFRAADPHKKMRFAIQTNGVLISDEWIDLFEEFKIGVGISMDGPARIHDAYRVDHKGRGSHAQVVAGLRKVQEAAREQRIGYGVLCVPTLESDPVHLASYFMDELEITRLNFLFMVESHDSEFRGRIDEWVTYYDRLVEYWLSRQGPPVHLTFFSEIMSGLMSDRGARMMDATRASRHNVISVSSDGHLGPDDSLKAVDSRFSIGPFSVFGTSLRGLLGSEYWRGFADGVDLAPAACGNCDWFRSCRSGDLYNRYSRTGQFERESVACEVIDAIHTRITSYLMRHGADLDQLVQRLKTPPTVKAIRLAGYGSDVGAA
jgi:uncharacterized protein